MLPPAMLLLAAPGFTAAPCPTPVIAFAPPLAAPVILHRRIERELATGLFVHDASYQLSFAQAGRGYRMHWQQIGERSEGPPNLLRLLELQERSVSGDSFDVTLGAGGAVLGISESAGSSQRLAESIARLRADPVLTARPAPQRGQIMAMLDRLAMLPPEERAALQRAWLERPVMLAGRDCRTGQVMTNAGAAYRIVRQSDEALHLAAAHETVRADGGQLSITEAVTLSRATGLLHDYDRRTVTVVAGTTRHARENLRLEPVPDAR